MSGWIRRRRFCLGFGLIDSIRRLHSLVSKLVRFLPVIILSDFVIVRLGDMISWD